MRVTGATGQGRPRRTGLAQGALLAGIALALLFGLLAAAPAARAQEDEAAEFVVRLNRIEGQMRQLSGQVEQLQFENRQLKEQLRKFQEDVEFRFQEGAGRRGASPPASPTPSAGNPARPARRSDAFDPDADPGAPGSPRPLGSPSGLPPAIAEARPPNPEPRPSARGEARGNDASAGAPPLDLGAAARSGTPPAVPAPARPSIAATGSDDPRADYDTAYAYLMQRQFDQAEMSFRRFIQSHPRDRLVPDATYWLGESYLQRNRPREAAEQFLRISTDYARSTKAPDAMLKLGVSLAALGARDQACATFAELERKYPAAPTSVRQGVDREQKRARCPA